MIYNILFLFLFLFSLLIFLAEYFCKKDNKKIKIEEFTNYQQILNPNPIKNSQVIKNDEKVSRRRSMYNKRNTNHHQLNKSLEVENNVSKLYCKAPSLLDRIRSIETNKQSQFCTKTIQQVYEQGQNLVGAKYIKYNNDLIK